MQVKGSRTREPPKRSRPVTDAAGKEESAASALSCVDGCAALWKAWIEQVEDNFQGALNKARSSCTSSKCLGVVKGRISLKLLIASRR